MLAANSSIILTAAVVLLGILLLSGIWVWKRKKRAKEEALQAERLRREDALNRALENPSNKRKEGNFEKQRRPFSVEYSQGENKSSAGIRERMFQLTEMTELSERKYMFRCSEKVQIGSQFGNITILPAMAEAEQIYCEIIMHKDMNYVRSTGNTEVLLKRGGKQAVVGRNGLQLRSGDVFAVGKTLYRIEFVR